MSSSDEIGLRSRIANSTLPPASLRPSVKIGLDTDSSQLLRSGCRGTKHFPRNFAALVNDGRRGWGGKFFLFKNLEAGIGGMGQAIETMVGRREWALS